VASIAVSAWHFCAIKTNAVVAGALIQINLIIAQLAALKIAIIWLPPVQNSATSVPTIHARD